MRRQKQIQDVLARQAAGKVAACRAAWSACCVRRVRAIGARATAGCVLLQATVLSVQAAPGVQASEPSGSGAQAAGQAASISQSAGQSGVGAQTSPLSPQSPASVQAPPLSPQSPASVGAPPVRSATPGDTNPAGKAPGKGVKAAPDASPLLINPASGKRAAATAADEADSEFNPAFTLPPNLSWPLLLNVQTWNNSLPVTQVFIDGQIQRCVLDTGLNACVLLPDYADHFNVQNVPEKVQVTALNHTLQATQLTLKDVRFGTLSIKGLRVSLLDVDALYMGQNDPTAPPLWLGTSFLSRFQVTLDYDSNTVTLEPADARLSKAKNTQILPLEVRDGRLYVRARVPGAGTFLALLDTAALGTLVPADIAAKLQSRRQSDALQTTYTIKDSAGQTTRAGLIRLPKLQVGRLEQENVPALYLEPEAPPADTNPPASAPQNAAGTGQSKPAAPGSAGTSQGSSAAPVKASGLQATPARRTRDASLGVLGSDFLRRYKVTINFARRQLQLVPPPPPKDTPDTPANTNSKGAPPPATRPVRPGNGSVRPAGNP